jgi:hypothetical protein
MNDALSFRNAERKDVPLILQFIKEPAAYEKMSDQVVADNRRRKPGCLTGRKRK